MELLSWAIRAILPGHSRELMWRRRQRSYGTGRENGDRRQKDPKSSFVLRDVAKLGVSKISWTF